MATDWVQLLQQMQGGGAPPPGGSMGQSALQGLGGISPYSQADMDFLRTKFKGPVESQLYRDRERKRAQTAYDSWVGGTTNKRSGNYKNQVGAWKRYLDDLDQADQVWGTPQQQAPPPGAAPPPGMSPPPGGGPPTMGANPPTMGANPPQMPPGMAPPPPQQGMAPQPDQGPLQQGGEPPTAGGLPPMNGGLGPQALSGLQNQPSMGAGPPTMGANPQDPGMAGGNMPPTAEAGSGTLDNFQSPGGGRMPPQEGHGGGIIRRPPIQAGGGEPTMGANPPADPGIVGGNMPPPGGQPPETSLSTRVPPPPGVGSEEGQLDNFQDPGREGHAGQGGVIRRPPVSVGEVGGPPTMGANPPNFPPGMGMPPGMAPPPGGGMTPGMAPQPDQGMLGGLGAAGGNMPPPGGGQPPETSLQTRVPPPGAGQPTEGPTAGGLPPLPGTGMIKPPGTGLKPSARPGKPDLGNWITYASTEGDEGYMNWATGEKISGAGRNALLEVQKRLADQRAKGITEALATSPNWSGGGGASQAPSQQSIGPTPHTPPRTPPVNPAARQANRAEIREERGQQRRAARAAGQPKPTFGGRRQRAAAGGQGEEKPTQQPPS